VWLDSVTFALSCCMSLSPHSHPPFPLLSSPFSSFPFPISPLLIAYPFCFDTVAHSFASLFLLSSLKSTASALFVKKKPGVGVPLPFKKCPKRILLKLGPPSQSPSGRKRTALQEPPSPLPCRKRAESGWAL